MQPRVSYYHLIMDRNHVLREALVAYPGRLASPVAIPELPLSDLPGFLSSVRDLGESAHLRHTDGILYRLTRFMLDDGIVLLAVPTYPPPTDWSELKGSAPIAMLADGIRHRPGLVLILGDMNSGKTTVAATYLAECLRLLGGTAFTWQDPIESDLEGWHGKGRCHQIEIDSDGYEEASIDALRTRAQFLFFGEPRTPSACLATMKGALGGPQMIATSHGDTLINGLLNFAAKAHILDVQSYNLLAACLTAAFHLTLNDAGDGKGPVLTVETLLVQQLSLSDPVRVAIRGQNLEGLITHIRSQRAQQQRAPHLVSGAVRR